MLGYIILAISLIALSFVSFTWYGSRKHIGGEQKFSDESSEDMPICNCDYPCVHYPNRKPLSPSGIHPYGKQSLVMMDVLSHPYMPPEQWYERNHPWPRGTNPYGIDINL